MGARGDCSAVSHWLPSYVHKKGRERQARQHCYLKTLIWCQSLQVTLLRCGAQSPSRNARLHPGLESACLGSRWRQPGKRLRCSGASRSRWPGDGHLLCGASAGTGRRAAERVLKPEERALPMCEAVILGERERERAGESLQSCKEGEILGSSSVEGQGIPLVGCCTFLPSAPRVHPDPAPKPHFEPALGVWDPGCSAGRQPASGVAAAAAAKRGAREFGKRLPFPLTS